MTIDASLPRLDARTGLRHGAWLAATTFAGMLAIAGVRLWNTLDAHAYWATWQHPFYSLPSGAPNAYLSSPAFTQVLWPFTRLPWPAFSALWMAGLAASVMWLV